VYRWPDSTPAARVKSDRLLEAEPVDPAHLAALLEGLAQAKRREFATDDEVEAAFRRFDP